jgi:hypothetical protein
VTTSADERLADVRRWWRATVPGPPLGQRAEQAYIVALTGAIFGALVYSTAHSALAQVITVRGTSVWGPGLVLVGLVVVARWGAYQGPVVFSIGDVGHTLGAPLPRRGLAVRPLARGLARGAAGGAVLGAVVLVGLSGDGGGLSAARAAGLGAGLAAAGVLGVAAAWGVQASARGERAVRRLTWVALVAAVAAAALAGQHHAVDDVLLWSGPWGWAVGPVALAAWPVALGLLALVTAAAAVTVLAVCGRCPTERHVRRAEARQSAVASLAAFDARSARRALDTVTGHRVPRPAAAWTSARGRPRLLLVWRGLLALGRARERAVEAVVLTAAATLVLVLRADRPLAALGSGALLYLGAARLLEPLRQEVDAPGRTRTLLRAPWGRVLLGHTALPAALTAATAALTAAGCALAGVLPDSGAALAVLAVAAAPVCALCAALSARRGGRLPLGVLGVATSDPSGAGGLVVLGWLLVWPGLAALGAGGPVALVGHGGAERLPAAAAVVLTTAAGLGVALGASRSP